MVNLEIVQNIPNFWNRYFWYILGLEIKFLVSIWMISRKHMHKAFSFSYFLDLFVGLKYDIIMTESDMIHVHKLD